MTSKLLFPVLVAGMLLAGCGVAATPTQSQAPSADKPSASFHVQSYYSYKPYYNSYYKPYYKPYYYPKKYYY